MKILESLLLMVMVAAALPCESPLLADEPSPLDQRPQPWQRRAEPISVNADDEAELVPGRRLLAARDSSRWQISHVVPGDVRSVAIERHRHGVCGVRRRHQMA